MSSAQNGNTALILAAYWNKPAVARLLLQRGADATPKDGVSSAARPHARNC